MRSRKETGARQPFRRACHSSTGMITSLGGPWFEFSHLSVAARREAKKLSCTYKVAHSSKISAGGFSSAKTRMKQTPFFDCSFTHVASAFRLVRENCEFTIFFSSMTASRCSFCIGAKCGWQELLMPFSRRALNTVLKLAGMVT